MRPAPSVLRIAAGLALVAPLLGACDNKSNVVLIGLPTVTPNPVPVGTKFVVNVGVLDAIGCNARATIAVTYNGVAISSKQVAIGSRYVDSTTAVASGTVSATGTCGSSVQLRNELVTVN